MISLPFSFLIVPSLSGEMEVVMKKKIACITVVVIFIAFGIGILNYNALIRPMPLLNSEMELADITFGYRSSSTGLYVSIDDFDEDLLLQYLNSCTIQWIGNSLDGMDPNISIALRETDGFGNADYTFIFLSDEYIVYKEKKGIYQIINGDAFLEKIKNMIGIDFKG